MHVIPNFVDTAAIVARRPHDRRIGASSGIGDGPVVLYAGNVGFSQSLDLMLAAAREIPQVTFLDQRRRLGAAGARTGRGRTRQRPRSPAT